VDGTGLEERSNDPVQLTLVVTDRRAVAVIAGGVQVRPPVNPGVRVCVRKGPDSRDEQLQDEEQHACAADSEAGPCSHDEGSSI
jgi:hypothetical protein